MADVPAPTGGVMAITGAALAQLIGVDERTIRKMALDGKVVRAKKPNQGKYEMVASIQQYCAYLREQAAGRQGTGGLSATDENTALKKITRERIQRQMLIEEDKLIRIEEVEEAAGEVLVAVRAIVMQFPELLQAACPHLDSDTIEQARIVAREVLALNSVAAWDRDPQKLPPALREAINERQGIAPT